MALLIVQNVGKTFQRAGGDGSGLRRIELDVERGEFISLLGPSGCGKTTTLRCIAGLETPDHGRIELDGTVLFSSDRSSGHRPVNVPPERRGIAMVFQDYALWPHMNVFENVAFGLHGARLSRAEVSTEVELTLRNVRLWDHRDKRISQLSGGQQQRVALARALAPKPKIILFDEPLSNLDPQLRDDMQLEILELQQRMGLTSIWVTHDQEEALGMSTRVVLMNDGRVEQIGKPAELWNKPATSFVASFLGTTNRMSGTVVTAENGGGPRLALSVDGAPSVYLPEGTGLEPGNQASIYVRPGAITISTEPMNGRANVWKAQVLGQVFYGEYTVVTVKVGSTRLKVRSDHFLESPPEYLDVQMDPSNIVAFRDYV
ncbi:ABC transporter ATP-binding protein [Nocardia sp. NBC_01503]|uniref:ABC transporter ATP-binding protein n=1 Tax=Nocardia sp. NBC_01503 TaxID=2975997 RepID=UPI002E7AD81B|nr:ABC transporter ATP-binding protein [Nocardia sp. NBC_01503]WTL32775.1 ABC transporter ATP-binding protein [Nocardia sp. NBC_01503]